MIKLIFSLAFALLLLACGPEAPAPSPGKVDAAAVPADARPEASSVVDSGQPVSDAGAPGPNSVTMDFPGEILGTNRIGAVVTSRALCPAGWIFLGRRCDSAKGPGLVLVDAGQLPGFDDAGAPQQGGFCSWRNDAADVSSGQGYSSPQSALAWATCLEGAR